MLESSFNESLNNPHSSLGLESNSGLLDHNNYLTGANTQEILFIVPDIPNYQNLIDGVGSNIEVITLDLAQNGVFQIGEVLARRQGISTVHIVSHGSNSSLQLGAANLNADTLLNYESTLAGWGNALTENADILFYGCNLTDTAAGVNLVQHLSEITGADIAASNDLTGSPEQGGDWNFETKIGTIEANLAFADYTIASYDYVFASLSGNISGTQKYGELIAAGPAKNSDNVTVTGNVTLTGDVTIDVVGDFTLNNFTISGDGVGDRDSLTINSTDKVTIGGIIGGSGFKNFTINAPKIEILGTATISTRLIDQSGAFDWLTSASTGDSGSINFKASANAKDFPGIFLFSGIAGLVNASPEIKVNSGAKLLAHVLDGDTTHKAGDITIQGEDIEQRLAGITLLFGYSNKQVDITVDGAIIKGANVTLKANAEDYNPFSEAPAWAQKLFIEPATNSLSYVLSKFTIPATVEVRGSDADITVKNSNIDASGKVDITTSANVDSSVKAISMVDDFGNINKNRFAAAYGRAVGGAEILIDGTTTIDANKDVNIASKTTTTAKVLAQVFGNVTQNLGNAANGNELGFAVAMANTVTTAKAIVNQDVTINSGGNVKVKADGKVNSEGKAQTSIFLDGKAGVGLGANWDETTIEATVNGKITASGSSVEKNLDLANVSSTNDTITIPNHGFKMGDEIVYNNGGGSNIGGLNNGETYTVFVVDENTIKLTKGEGLDLDNSNVTSGVHHSLSPQKGIFFDPATAIDVNTDIITLANHGLTTGQQVVYSSDQNGTDVNELDTGVEHYVIVVNANQIKLAYTIDAAAKGTAINFVENAEGSDKASGTGTSHLFNYNQQVQTKTAFDPTGTGVVNINNDTIAITNHGFATGQIINYSSGTGTAIGGLTSGRGYFAIVVDKNTIKLANTIAEAESETAINLLAGAVGTAHQFTFMTSPIQFDPGDDAIVDSGKNTIKITNHGFTTGQTLYYQVDPTISTTESLPFNLSFEPATEVDVATDKITLQSHGLQDGEIVTYEIGYLGESATVVGGLTANATYKVKVVDANTIQLLDPTTQAVKDLTSTGTGSLHNLKVSRTVTAGDTAIRGLTNQEYYHVVVIDANTIQLTEDVLEAVNAKPIELDPSVASVPTGKSQSFKIPQATSGITIAANLDATDKVIVKGSNGSSPKWRDLLANPALLYTSGTSSLFEPGRAKDLLKGKQDVKDSKGNLIQNPIGKMSDNTSISVGVGFGLNLFKHTVTANVGSSAVLKSSADVTISATTKQKLQTLVEAATSKDGAGKAVAVGIGVGIYTNTVQATVANNAQIDAKGKLAVTTDLTYPFLLDFKKDFDFTNDPLNAYGNLAVLISDVFLDGSLGFPKRILNTFVTSKNKGGRDVKDGVAQQIKGGDFGFALSGSYSEYNNTSAASIGDNAKINQQTNYRTDNQAVLVSALTDMTLLNAVGIFHLDVAVDNIARGAYKNDATEAINFFGNRAKSGLGVSVLVQQLRNTTTAKVGAGAFIHTGSLGEGLDVKAKEDIFWLDFVQSGGDAEKVGFSGSGLGFVQDSTTIAQIGTGVNITGGSVSVKAESDVQRYAILGSIQQTDNVGIGASVGYNEVDRTTKAIIGKDVDDTTQPVGNPVSINVAGNIDLEAKNTGNYWVFSLAGSYSEAAQPGAPEPGDYGVNVSGNVALNYIDDTAQAYINNAGTITTTGNVSLNAINDSFLGTFSGGFAFGGNPAPTAQPSNATKVSLYGAYSLNDFKNKTQAFIIGAAVTAGDVELKALEDVIVVSGSIGLAGNYVNNPTGGATSVNVAGSVSQNIIKNTTEAFLQNASVNATGNLKLTADDTSQIYAIAGLLGLGITTGTGGNANTLTVGVSAATNKIENTIRAYIDNSTINATATNTGNVEVTAKVSEAKIFALTLAGSVASSNAPTNSAFGVAGAGSGSGNTVDSDIAAFVSNNSVVNIKNTSKSLSITATDNSYIEANAGGFSLALAQSQSSSVAVSVGVSASVNKITNSTIAYVDKSRVLSTGTVSITADSTATIKALSIAGSVSGTQSSGGLSGAFTGAGAGSGNTINNTIEATIKNTANVSSRGTITLLAKDSSKITADAGGVAIAVALGSSSSLAGSIGASVATNDIDNKIRAVIEGAGTTVTSTIGAVSVTATSTATIDNFVLGGSVAGAQGSGGAAAGSGASARNEITNTIETAIKNSAIVTANGAIALLAKDTSTITSDAGGGSLAIAAGGNTGVALAIGVALAENIVNNQVSAYIDNAKASSTSNNIISITADSDATITAKSVAVSIAIAAGQNIGAGFSGGGAAATNVILTDTNAYIKGSVIDNVGNLTLTTTSDNTIDADVVAIAGSVGAGSGGGGVAAAIGGSLARNYIGYEANGTKSPSQVRAYIQDSSINARGALSLTATATDTITADVGAGALAVAASSEIAVSLVGAGAVAENKVAAEVKAFINGDGATGISANSIALKADDTTTNTARVGAASVGVSFSGSSAVAASIGVSLARNDIRNEVQAYIQNANNKVEARNGSLTIEAIERSTITSNAVAVSVSVAVSTNLFSASLALSGTGAESTNIINNSVKAFVDNSIIETKGGNANDIKLDAQSTSHISALAGAVGVAGSGGLLAASGSIGVSLARNLIGYDSITDDSGYGNEVLAYIKDSTATSTGDIKVYATNTDTIETVSFAGSVALSFGVGLAIAGAGAESTSKMSSNIYAYLENTQATAGVDLEVKATSDSQVTKAHTVGAAIAAVIGVGGAISVAASNVINKIENNVQAYVKSSTAKTIQATTGNILISADVSRARISNVTAVTASIAVDSSLSGFAFSGGGVGLYNTVDNKVDAYITGPVTANANTGNVSVLASEDAFLSSDATVITVAVSLISAALGVAVVENKINSTIQAWVDDNSSTAWTATTPATALTTIINSVNTTIDADSVANIDKTLTAGVSGATVGVTGNKAEADIKTAVKAFVEGTKLASSGDIEIKSIANNKARTSANGGAFGGLAIGAMASTVNLGQGNSVDEVVATLGNGTQITAKVLRIQATSDDDLLAESVAAGGGAIAVAGAQSNVTSDLATLANIGNNAQINVNSLTVTSDHEQDVDAAADSFQFALAVGSGAGVSNNITSKANVDIGTSTTINAADNVIINAINRFAKDQFKDADARSNLRSGSAAFGNLSVLASATDIGTSTNPFEALVNVGNGTNITVQGTNKNPGLLRIETLNDVTAFDSVRLETVAGFGMGIGLSRIDATTKAGVNLNGATLNNKSGDVYLTAKTNSGLRPSTNLLAATYFGGVAASDARTTNNATNQIKVDGATIKGSDIYLYTGKDSFGIPNLLDSSANSEITSISFGPALSIPVLKAEINETNQIDIIGLAKVQALEDVNLIAEKGLEGDSKRSQTDGLILNLSLIPYGFDVPDGSSDNRTNKVNIGSQAIIEAGINNKSVVQIKPLTLGGVQQLDPAKLGTELSATEKQTLGLSSDIKYEYGKLNLDQVGFSISTGTVIKVVSGANQGGTAGNYYKYKPVNNTADTIILEAENFSNSSRWENLGATLTTEQEQTLSIYDSNATLGLKNTLKDKFYVIKPVDLAAPTFSYVNIGNLLIDQRQKVLDWIANHAGNAEAIARYQVQLEDINQTLKDLGLFETVTNSTTGQTATLIKKELDALFLELPNIYAAPGSIFIEDNQSTTSTFTSLLGNRLIARAGAEINVLNQSPFTLKVNDTIIRDNKRVVVNNGAYTVLEPGNVYLNNALVSGASSNTGDKKISIVQDAFAKSQYSLGTLQLPSIDQDMFIVGDVINESGDLLIDNKEGSINVSGEIRAENVTIRAARDFNLNVDDWFHTNQDPRQYINYDTLRSQVFNTDGTKTTKTFNNPSDVTGLQAAINQKKSSILAQGAISVTARYLNVNGLIQSGVDTVTLNIASTFNPGNITRTFVDDDGNALAGISFGTDKVPVDGYFDAQNQAIVVEDIIPQGGRITLAGKIFSTGNGQLKVANGYANVNVNNDSNYKLIVNRIDNTTNRQGKITIIDTDTLKKTEYAVDGNGVKETRSQGTLVPASGGEISKIDYTQTGTTPYSSFSADIKYQPDTGLKYVWTEGQEKTSVVRTKYEKNTFNLFGDNDFADLLSKDESYSWRTVEFRDEQPLLESESLLPDGTNNPPSYSTGKAYTIQYEQRNDDTIDLIKDVSLVKYNGVVYRYTGDNADLKLSTQTYTDTTRWTATTINAATFVQDPAQNKFNSDYVNSSLSVETWTTGGGWLRKKTYHTLTTEVTGLKDFYTHSLKADYAIDIDFLIGSSAPQISISSDADIYLQGNIDTPNSGKINLSTSNGSVQTTNTNAIFGAISNIDVKGDFKAIVSGSNTPLNVKADGDIEITVVSEDNQSSSLVVGNITSTNGNVIINAPNGITAQNANSQIKGNQVELRAEDGAIGTTNLAVNIDSNTEGDGGFAAKAEGSINIFEKAGDLKLAEATSWDGNAAVESSNGDVRLETANGSILDGIQELFTVGDRLDGSVNSSVQALINNGTVSADALKYPISPGLYSALYPNADFLGLAQNTSAIETPNIIGNKVTLIAKANVNEVGEIGRISDTVSINLSQGYAGLTTAEKQILSTAAAEDILGVVYEIYEYVGSNTTGADVSQGKFSDTSKWQKLTPNFITGSDRLTAQSAAIAQNQIVLVQYSAEEYGLYKYLGQSKTLDLSKQDYDTVSLWQKVTVNHRTNDNGTPLAVIPDVTTVKDGDLIYRYIGTSASFNLTNVDYAKDSNWKDITFTQDPSQNRYESTYGNTTTRVAVVSNTTLVKNGNTIYRYIGASAATLDLRTENYSNTVKWKVDTSFEIATNFLQNTSQNLYDSTFRNQNKTLLNGQLVENRFVVSRLALQLQDDVDLQAANAVTIEADSGVTAQTTGNLQINHVRAGDNVRLVADGAITDLGTDSTAAITTLGDLTLRSENSSISGANNSALRIQVAPTGLLSVRAQGSINLQQVAADTTVDGQFQAISDLYVARANAGGEVKIAVAEGNMIVGKVIAGNSANITAANNILDAFNDQDATVVNISTATGNVNLNAGGDIGTNSNFLDVEIPVGQFSATAGNDVFLHSVVSLNVADIISTAGDVTLDVDGDVKIDPITATSGTVTINADGSIIDALNDDNSEINAVSIKLTAGGAIGTAANSLDIDSSNATLGTVAATANGGVYLIETNGDLRVDLIKSQTTDVTLVAKNGSILDANGDAVNIEGVNINLTATTGSIGEVTNDLEIDSTKPTAGKLKATATNNIYINEISGGLNINSVDAAQGDVRLTVKETAATGEDLLLDGTAQVTAANASVTLRAGDNITADANSLISAKQNITILGDYGNADPVGTTINLNGRILATNVLIQGEANADIITLHLQELVGNTSVLGGDSNDQIIVDRLPSLDKTRRGQSNRNNLTLNGQTGGDIYTVNITGTVTDYITNVFDTGTDPGQDQLTIYGTNVADNFLLRAAEDRVNGVAFVAALHGDPIVDVERVNYNLKLEKLIVNAQDGDDTVTLDDNWAETTVTGGIGNDKFQVGQIFKSQRDAAAGVAPKDVFEIVQTTRGYLSNGVSFTTTLDGDTGNDTFTVYRNKAVLNLNGGDNDDLFVIRAFAEEGSSDNNVTAGQGADNIQYVVNAPINVNGGDGNDILKIIGTEFADKFVVTANAISGAGRTVNYNNIETVIIDGAEGDDEFYVLSTNTGVVTKLFGGLGSDRFSLGGDVPTVAAGTNSLPAQEGSHKVDGIQGQLIIDGFGGEGSTALAEPVMLPGETNLLASTGKVLAYSAANNTITVATADVLSLLNNLIGKTLEISRGNGLRRFWQIINVTQSNGQTVLTLQNPSLPDPTWEIPGANSEYAINNLSPNFFVNEDETLDLVTAFNDGSTANTVGNLTANTLTGLGMGATGVTYNNFEVVEVLLGTGNDQFIVAKTADGAMTVIHGGGGNDTITVSDRGGVDARGKDAPLAIFGDTTQDGNRYTDTSIQVKPGFAYSFTNPGNDIINASASTKNVSIYGGAGNDSITGSQAGDQIAGGSGDDNINGQGGADHIYGDAGFNLDTATRELTVPNVNSSVNPSRDSLTVGNDTIDGSSGDNIIFGDYGIITQTTGTSRIITTGNVIQVETANPASGGNDTISTGSGQDIILGGNGNDTVNAGDGKNIVIGDSGKVTSVAGNVNRIETTDSNLGGNDTISTGNGEDIVLGGFASDNITTSVSNDIAFGDNGYVSYVESDSDTADIDRIKITNVKDGGNDTINSGAGNDIVLGGVGNDQINASDDNDLIFGDNGVVEGDVNANLLPLSTLTKPFTFTSIDTTNTDTAGNSLGGNDTILAGAGKDIMIAGQGNDTVSGEAGDDDIIGGHNVAGGNDGNDVLDGGTGNDAIAGDNASILRRGDTLSPRIRKLNGQIIYDSNGTAQVNSSSQLNPTGVEERTITLFDHSDTPAANTFGNDNIVGGAQDDVIFGQLGDDTIQGDASVAINVTPTTASVEDFAGAGSDGDDYIEGNGGGDLILGNLGQDDIIGGSSNLFSLTQATQRPDGADTIFGGAGTDIARNDQGDTSANGHARDADYILGDNGNILRLIGSNGQFFKFNYDFYGSLKLIPRAIQLLDYTQGGAASDRGTGDVLHGESGDDVIHGMMGNDVIFGEGQDDDIYGGVGSDRIYGGAGEDGILGDDGKIFTSRNGLTEALYGVNTINAQVNLSISGPFTGAWVYITGRLNKTVDLAAVESGSSDIIYGGLGDDFLHGGAGDDGISGAEVQAAFYNSNPVTNTNPLGYDSVTRKLAAYDANNPMKKITSFFLNFDAVDGSGIKINDGKDNIFGDLGNDWLVSGTQNDRLFGGLGDDVLNADDNLDTAGGLNNQPDVTEFADRDFAFGGGGLDVLIGNTGGDRLFDWNGEYNSYWVPFSPFGNPTVVRSPSPQIQQFLLNLGKSSGADQTLTEPNGELGLTTSGENGSPRDPQGNNSNASRDTQGAPEDDRATSLPLTGN